MEITCNRCRQPVEDEKCYCSNCGLPQLVYATEGPAGQAQAERWDEVVRDAATIEWKPALRVALMMAVPAGVLSSAVSPMGHLKLIWMTVAASWAVVLYMRNQQPAWLTMGAGARVGLVTGVLAAWLAFSIGGGALLAQRYVFHQSNQIDAEWKANVDMSQQLTQQWSAQMGLTDTAQLQAQRAFMLSPEGHGGFVVFGLVTGSLLLVLFGVVGGAMGARLRARSRKPEI